MVATIKCVRYRYEMSDTHFAVAIHTLAALALSGDIRVTSSNLAGSIRTSDAFVRRVLGALRVAGVVTSEKGASGGIRLARPADQITLGSVYCALRKSPILRTASAVPNPECPVGGSISPIVRDIFADAEDALVERLNETTIGALATRIHSREQVVRPAKTRA